MKERILLVWFHDYHIFRFMGDLALVLGKSGYDVTLLTCDNSLKDRFEKQGVRVSYRPYLRPIIRWMSNIYMRPFIWLFGWLQSILETRRFDIILAPQDNKPFYHMITAWKKSLICRPALGFFDKSYIQHKLNSDVAIPDITQFSKGKYRVIDRLLGGSYLNELKGDISKKYYTVFGEWTGEFLQKLGVPKDHVFSVGNLNYEGLTLETVNIQAVKGKYFLDINDDTDIYTFFSSQQYFGENELDSLNNIAEIMRDNNAYFIIKIHPKLDIKQKEKLIGWGKENFPETVKIIHDLKGDYSNACLISLSKSVLIEESNVGILAMHFDKPVIIIDLGGKKDCEDNIFKLFDGILVCDDSNNLSSAIEQINSKDELSSIMAAQQKFVHYVCIKSQSPCGIIPNIIKEII